jgi:integrase
MPETRKNTPRLRNGVMKRGTTWSYVIRVKDPETAVSKPRWVGGFATEDDAKAARDEARVKARHGEYIDRNRITVAAYLDDAYTGARRGELLNLRWQDVDLDGKKITITGSTAVIGGERVNGTTKSGRTRVVSIDAETVAVLRQRKADQAAEQFKAGDS